MIHTQPIGPIEAAQRAAHAERRRRLMGLPPAPILRVKPVAPMPAPGVIKRPKPVPEPQWKRSEIEFDAHVKTWLLHQQEQSSPVQYVKRRVKELGFTFKEIVGPYRGRRVVAARQLLMWEVKTQYPEVSFPRLGRMFGGRDHTTAMHAVGKIEKQRVGQ